MSDRWQGLRAELAAFRKEGRVPFALDMHWEEWPEPTVRKLLDERDRLAARIAEALEFCEDREDIVDGEHGPLPNLAMQVATILKGPAA